jgi:hypothetical protein
MSATHVHLMLNHLPVLAGLFGMLLLGAGLLRKSEDLKRAGLLLFVGGSLGALPVYLTGQPAETTVRTLPGITSRELEKHKEVAQLALSAVLVLGGLSAAAFWLFRKGAAVPRGFALGVLAVALLSSGLLAWTAHLGGQIRHTEIRADSTGEK